eukprot:TRINITY_DN49350_c0_g1_i1.p1 TRINITY_DN49350_c0_g1~~TRINITY_DN49350_c0_g1_i1.p1  ORF type:complete len:349 (+),score=33.94 TRINITY_DN49350_c0_g1_i1:82-1128(+)
MNSTLNHYDGHRTICTLEDKAIAARLSGHTWNIINNKDEHEIYLRHARSDEHYVDEKGNTSSAWIEKKKRVPHPVGGNAGANWSGHITESLKCPSTPSRDQAESQPPHPGSKRQLTQLLQSSAPRDFALYAARKNEVTPRTPLRETCQERLLEAEDQKRLRDIHTKKPGRVVDRHSWTPRRGEQRIEARPPREEDMFAKVSQLRSESHVDVKDKCFAENLRPPTYTRSRLSSTPRQHSSGTPRISTGGSGSTRSSRAGSARGVSAVNVAAAHSARSKYEGEHPRHPKDRTRHSSLRLEGYCDRELSNWTLRDDKLMRHDPFAMRPMQQATNSGVKYDIITNERSQFWY